MHSEQISNNQHWESSQASRREGERSSRAETVCVCGGGGGHRVDVSCKGRPPDSSCRDCQNGGNACIAAAAV